MANTEQNGTGDETDGSGSGGDTDGVRAFGRRRYLQLAGLTLASAAGGADMEARAAPGTAAAGATGYGGAPPVSETLQSSLGRDPSPPDDGIVHLDTEAQISSRLSADVDWYAFDVSEATDVAIKYDRADPRGVSAVALYDADRTLVDQAYVASDEPVYFPRMSAHGTHYLQTADIWEGAGEYAVTVVTDVTADEQTPYQGTVSSLPGRVEAEAYDLGGEGVGYHDTTAENVYDTSVRDSGVDLREAQDDGGGYAVGYFQDGEWLEYTVDPEPGIYDVHLRLATDRSNRSLELSLDGDSLGTVEVPDTGGWREWETVTLEDVRIQDGEQQVLRVTVLGSGVDFNWVEFDGVELQGPFQGTPATIPGRIEAEAYDLGGEGVGYHDTTAENVYDTSVRDSGVDLRETQDDGGGYTVGYFEDGEWLEYTVDVEPGHYDLHARVASTNSGRELAVTLGDRNLGTVTVPDTGGWRQWETVTVEDVAIPTGGRRVLRLTADGGGQDLNWVEFEPITVREPFQGTPATIPGRIEAEAYDLGGEGVGYHDTTAENVYDTSVRDSGVDLRETQDDGGGYTVGYFEDGEWLEYTVDVEPGHYDLHARVASTNSGRELAVTLGDRDLGTVTVPNTGSWREWETVTLEDVTVESDDRQVLRLQAVGSGLDLNWVEFATRSKFGTEGYGIGGYGGTD